MDWCKQLELSNHDWTNQFSFGSIGTFPDCKNESSCQCIKCLTICCLKHFQIHSAVCNYINTSIKVEDGPPHNILDKIDRLDSKSIRLM